MIVDDIEKSNTVVRHEEFRDSVVEETREIYQIITSVAYDAIPEAKRPKIVIVDTFRYFNTKCGLVNIKRKRLYKRQATKRECYYIFAVSTGKENTLLISLRASSGHYIVYYVTIMNDQLSILTKKFIEL